MSIAVRCRSCGRTYNLADRLAGQLVKCAECGCAVEVPHGDRQIVVAESVPFRQPMPPLPTTLSNPLLAPRRKKNKSPVVLAVVGGAAVGLVVLAAIIYLMLPTRSPTLASTSSERTTATVTLTGRIQPIAPSAAGGPGTSSLTNASHAKAFEELVQKVIAALHGFNHALSQIVDGESARRQADQVMAKYNDLIDLNRQMIAQARRVTPEDDRRLESIYGPQLKLAAEQLKGQAIRIRQIQHAELAFGGRLPFESFHERMGVLHGRANAPSFQPPTPPSFRPPRPPTYQPPRPPVTGPRHPPINQGMHGHGPMHGRRGR